MPAHLAAVPTAKTPSAREYLRQAQAKLKEAADKRQRIHEQRQRLLDFGQRPEEIAERLRAARGEHTAALRAWAESGASGDSPAPPAGIAKLEAQLAIANSEAHAAATAATAFDADLAAAQQAADAALAELRYRREDVLYVIAAPLVEEFKRAAFKANSLREHLAGLGMVGGALLKESPRITKVGMDVNDVVSRFRPVLELGGAEASRQAWQNLIADLASDADAGLDSAPASVDPDAQIRKPFLPDYLRGEA